MSLQTADPTRLLRGDLDEDRTTGAACHGINLQPGERWVCVHSAPHKELFAAANLEHQGYRPFVPKLAKTVRHARRTKRVFVAFLPRYLFVTLNAAEQPWRPIRNTFGVSSLVMENDRPKPVPFGVVESFVRATNEAGSLDFRQDVAVGQNVRLLSGPFADLVGTLAHLDGRGRVMVLLNIMGGERLITTKSSALQPAG